VRPLPSPRLYAERSELGADDAVDDAFGLSIDSIRTADESRHVSVVIHDLNRRHRVRRIADLTRPPCGAAVEPHVQRDDQRRESDGDVADVVQVHHDTGPFNGLIAAIKKDSS